MNTLLSRAASSFLLVSCVMAWVYPWAARSFMMYVVQHGSFMGLSSFGRAPPWKVPFPLTLAVPLSFPLPQHFVPFLKYISLEMPLNWLMGSAVPCDGSAGELSGISCLARTTPVRGQPATLAATNSLALTPSAHPTTGAQSTPRVQRLLIFVKYFITGIKYLSMAKLLFVFCDIEYT